MIMTAISPEAPKIVATLVEGNVKIDDMLCGRTITITEEQARELSLTLDVMFNEYYKQEEK